MENIKHTPGPWVVDEQSEDQLAICNTDKDLAIAFIPIKHPKREANIKLIAAAPELLKALQDLSEEVGRQCSIGSDDKLFELFHRFQNAKAAIAKATL